VLLRIHNMHRPALEQLLVALATAGEASYLAMAGAAAESAAAASEGSNSHLGSPVVGGRKALDSPIMHGRARNVGDIMYAKYQEFWISIGTEVSRYSVLHFQRCKNLRLALPLHSWVLCHCPCR
jgi:hypothetical protein